MMKYYQEDYESAADRRLSFGPGALSPFIKVMLIANTAVFIAQKVYPPLDLTLGLVPHQFFSEFPERFYQPLTYMFLHGGFWHLFFNMLMLWMFGTEIEFTWGTRSFARFYLLAGVAGALLTLLVKSSDQSITVGASGAIYGVLAAYWIMFPQRLLYIYFILPVKVKWAIPGLMILGFLLGGANVAHFAHLGGALFGVAYLKADWRWLRIGDKLKEMRYRRQSAKLEKNRQKAEEIMKRVDEILDRINEVGIDNISKEDRKFLEEASSRLSERKIND